MKDLIKVATKIRDAFHYDPGHSDLDREQPINVTIELGTWRDLNFILNQIGRTAPEGERKTVSQIYDELAARADERAKAIEECARVCDLLSGLNVHGWGRKSTTAARTCATEIRALNGPDCLPQGE